MVDPMEMSRAAFKAMDTRLHGFLKVEDLVRAAAEVAPHLSKGRLEAIFREADRNGDGRVTFHDFLDVMEATRTP